MIVVSCLLNHLQDPVYAVALDVHVWSVIYALIFWHLRRALHCGGLLLAQFTVIEIRYQTQGHLH